MPNLLNKKEAEKNKIENKNKEKKNSVLESLKNVSLSKIAFLAASLFVLNTSQGQKASDKNKTKVDFALKQEQKAKKSILEQVKYQNMSKEDFYNLKLTRKNDIEKKIFNSITEAYIYYKENSGKQNVYYKEGQVGGGSLFRKYITEKEANGGVKYKGQDAYQELVLDEKIKNDYGEITKEDLEINGKILEVLKDDEFLMRVPNDYIALEEVSGGKGFVNIQKGTIFVVKKTIKNGKDCFILLYRHICYNPDLSYECVSSLDINLSINQNKIQIEGEDFIISRGHAFDNATPNKSKNILPALKKEGIFYGSINLPNQKIYNGLIFKQNGKFYSVRPNSVDFNYFAE